MLVGAEERAHTSWELTGHTHSGESPRPLSIPTSHTHLYCQASCLLSQLERWGPWDCDQGPL